MNIGDNIKKYRKDMNLTQKQLGEMINKSTIAIRKYESNDTIPPFDVLEEISKVLDVPMVLLLPNTAEKHGQNPEHITIKNFTDIPEYSDFINFVNGKYGSVEQDFIDLFKGDYEKEDLIEKENKIRLLKPMLDYYNLKFKIYPDKRSVAIDMPNGNIHGNIDFDTFIDFIDRLYWGVEREIDYLKHLCD